MFLFLSFHLCQEERDAAADISWVYASQKTSRNGRRRKRRRKSIWGLLPPAEKEEERNCQLGMGFAEFPRLCLEIKASLFLPFQIRRESQKVLSEFGEFRSFEEVRRRPLIPRKERQRRRTKLETRERNTTRHLLSLRFPRERRKVIDNFFLFRGKRRETPFSLTLSRNGKVCVMAIRHAPSSSSSSLAGACRCRRDVRTRPYPAQKVSGAGRQQQPRLFSSPQGDSTLLWVRERRKEGEPWS